MVSIVATKRKFSAVWKYFELPKGEKESSKAICKICNGKYERGGGTSNLKNHLRNWHHSEFDELYPAETPSASSSKQGTMDSFSNRVEKLSSNSSRAKKLTRAFSLFFFLGSGQESLESTSIKLTFSYKSNKL